MEQKPVSIPDAIAYLGSRWQDAKLKDGDVFCACENPQHNGCSIATSKQYCEPCTRGCLQRSSKP